MVFRGWRGAARLGNSSHGKIYTTFLYSDAEYRDHVALNDPLKTQIQREITWFTQTQRFHNPPAFVLIRDVHEADSEGKCSFCQRQIQGPPLTNICYHQRSHSIVICTFKHGNSWKILSTNLDLIYMQVSCTLDSLKCKTYLTSIFHQGPFHV